MRFSLASLIRRFWKRPASTPTLPVGGIGVETDIHDTDLLLYPAVAIAWQQRQAALVGEYEIVPLSDRPELHALLQYADDLYTLLQLTQYYALYGTVAIFYNWELYGDYLLPTNYTLVIQPTIKGKKIVVLTTEGEKTFSFNSTAFTLVQNSPTPTHPSGFALVDAIRPLVERARQIERYWKEYLRSFSAPSLIVEAGDFVEPDQLRAFVRELERIRDLGIFGYRKDEYEIRTIEPSRSNPQDFNIYIDYINKQITKLIIGQTLTADAQTSSYALGKVHQNTLQAIVSRDAKIIEDALNRWLIPQFYALNEIEPSENDWVEIRPRPKPLTMQEILPLVQMGYVGIRDLERILGVKLEGFGGGGG